MNIMNQRKGFTLIELIVVIGIIALMTAGIVVALRPAERIAQSKNARRWQEATAIAQAASLRITDGGGLRDDTQCGGLRCFFDQCLTYLCTDNSACLGGQECVSGRCTPTISCSAVDDRWHMIGTGNDCAHACGFGSFVHGNLPDVDVDGSQPFSISAWIKVDANGGDVLSNMTENDERGWRLAIIANRVSFIMRNNGEQLDALSSTPLSVGAQSRYHHLAVIYTPGSPPLSQDNIVMYLDGASMEMDSWAGRPSLPATLPSYDGLFHIGGRSTSLFQGSIADVQFFPASLSQGDVADLALGNAIASVPTHHWMMNEGAGQIIDDEYDEEATGVLSGNADWTTESPPFVPGHAVRFGGSTTQTCIDLGPELVASGLLATLPVNQTTNGITPDETKTYYAIRKSGGAVTVRSCLADGGAQIEVSR